MGRDAARARFLERARKGPPSTSVMTAGPLVIDPNMEDPLLFTDAIQCALHTKTEHDTYEWWHDGRKLTVDLATVEPTITRVWGSSATQMRMESFSEDDFPQHWAWLMQLLGAGTRVRVRPLGYTWTADTALALTGRTGHIERIERPASAQSFVEMPYLVTFDEPTTIADRSIGSFHFSEHELEIV